MAVALNFEYRTWDFLPQFLQCLVGSPAKEFIWLAQENRPLPGTEKALHASLPAALRQRWPVREIDPVPPTAPLASPRPCWGTLTALTENWPTSEWLISARFHSAIVGAWAGSKIILLATNQKLAGLAAELGCPKIAPSEYGLRELSTLLSRATPTSMSRLSTLAAAAEKSCHEFLHCAYRYSRQRIGS